MSIVDDVKDYEDWLATQCDVVKDGLKKKRKRMAKDEFSFFRATCFRFARKIDKWAPGFDAAPRALCVGDAHIENWGTWRDDEGRLVWGVNDFDEAAELPYAYDLIRLAASARLAKDLPEAQSVCAAAIIEGYRRGLVAPRPTFVDDEAPWLQELVNRPAAKAGAFRAELEEAEPATPPPAVVAALTDRLPQGTGGVHFGAWQRGGGSLGRPRYVAYGDWRGGLAAREAKALVPSAWAWARNDVAAPILFGTIANGDYRSPDPFLRVDKKFVVRRIAADSAKIDFGSEAARNYGRPLLTAMGLDLASIHIGDGRSPTSILADLDARNPDWLYAAAKAVAEQTIDDFEKWRDHYDSK
jgi:hypothetical protein